jgi:hypothetical protein
LIAALGLALALTVALAVVLLVSRVFVGEALPNPNGYDDLVTAGRSIQANVQQLREPQTSELTALRALVAENNQALARARIGLGRKSVVALSRSPSIYAHLDDFNTLRKLGRLLACEAMLAEREGRTTEATKYYADLIRFSRAISLGGTMIDRMAENPIQVPAINGLTRLAEVLPAEDARRLAAEIEQVDRDREPLNQVFARDLKFSLAGRGVQARVAYTLFPKPMKTMIAPAKVATERADQSSQASLRRLAATLALRAYRLDHPEAPAPTDFVALVPRYLKAVPVDPFSKQPMAPKLQQNSARADSPSQNERPRSGNGSEPRGSH